MGGRRKGKRGQHWDSNFGCGVGVGRHVFGEIAKRPGRTAGGRFRGWMRWGSPEQFVLQLDSAMVAALLRVFPHLCA